MGIKSHRPIGWNKIQNAWSSKVFQVIDVQGTTHKVVPVNGDPVKRVHKSNLRCCVNPVLPRRHKTQKAPANREPEANEDSETESTDSNPESQRRLVEQVKEKWVKGWKTCKLIQNMEKEVKLNSCWIMT